MAVLHDSTRFLRCGDVSVGEAVNLFRSLNSVVSGVDVRTCGSSELDALTAGVRIGQRALDRLLIRIGAAADKHADQSTGRGSHATMLGDGSNVRGHTARRESARAQTAAAMPKVAAAVDEGRIGAAQVDAIANAAQQLAPEDRQLLDSDAIVEAAAALPADVFARRIRGEAERVRGDSGLSETKAKQARSSWKHWVDQQSGMGKIFGEFDPERYEAIVDAVENQVSRLANDGGVSKTSNLAAEAAFLLLTGAGRRTGGLPHINIVVDHQTFADGSHNKSLRETAAGHSLPPEAVGRLACDAVVQRVVFDKQGVPVNVGRKSRTATDAQWQAIRSLYRTCVWRGCERPLTWCQAHHIHEWEHGGQTDLCNLIPLCNRHHHAVHQGGWQVELRPNRQLDIYDPNQILWATTMPDRVQKEDEATRSSSRSVGNRSGRSRSSSPRHGNAKPGGP